MPLLSIKNLSVWAHSGKKILQNVSLAVQKNSIHALIGPNGSGKSTLAYALMGLAKFKKVTGRIIFDGQDITRQTTPQRAKRGLTLAWQEPARFEGIKVKDFLLAGVKRNPDESQASQMVSEALQLVSLEPNIYLERLADQSLSVGERKRIELASVLMLQPKLMILDEPDAGLDIIVYREFYQFLSRLQQETNASILLITHREEVGLIAQQASLLWQGRLLASGPFVPIMRKYCQLSHKQRLCPLKSCLKNL